MKKSSHFKLTHSRNNSKNLDKLHLKTEANNGPPPLYSMVIPETMSNAKFGNQAAQFHSAIISDHNAPSQRSIDDDNLSQ